MVCSGTGTSQGCQAYRTVTDRDDTGQGRLVVILVHTARGVSRLGPTGPLSHDDLVHPQDGGGGICGVLKSPLLGQEQIQNVRLKAVLNGINKIGPDSPAFLP